MEAVTVIGNATMLIQHDWESFINVPYKTIWIGSKNREKSSVIANIRGDTLECDNPEFSAVLCKNHLSVSYLPTNRLCHFIPAAKQFKNVQKNDTILSIDISEGGLAVSSCSNGRVYIWDSQTGEVRKELSGHLGDVYKCRFFPSGLVILSAGADMRIKIWSAESGICPVTLCGHTRAITDFCIVDRGRNVVSVGKDGAAVLWDVGNGSKIDQILTGQEKFTCCAIGQLPEGMPVTKSPNEREVATEDKILLVGSEEGNVYGIQLSTRNVIFVANLNSPVSCLLYFSNSLFSVGTQDGQVVECSLINGSKLKIFHESNSPVLSMTRFQQKGILIGRQCGMVTYLNLLSGTSDRIELTGSDCDPVYDIAVTNDAIYTACRDNKIRKYNATDLLATGV